MRKKIVLKIRSDVTTLAITITTTITTIRITIITTIVITTPCVYLYNTNNNNNLCIP
jgi:hypothetical protein